MPGFIKYLFVNRLSPLVRTFISLAVAGIVLLILRSMDMKPLMIAVLSWSGFALCYLILDWIIIINRKVDEIRKKARQDDGSVVFVFFIILIASLASMFAVLFLTTSKDEAMKDHALYIPAAVGSMILSWFVVHTQYIFHYAHEYYDENEDENSDEEQAGGLDFPEEDEPDYLDFAYFSLCMACTFQVSDVDVTSKLLRRIVMIHGVLAFFMNTFVVALTINLVAGMSQE